MHACFVLIDYKRKLWLMKSRNHVKGGLYFFLFFRSECALPDAWRSRYKYLKATAQDLEFMTPSGGVAGLNVRCVARQTAQTEEEENFEMDGVLLLLGRIVLSPGALTRGRWRLCGPHDWVMYDAVSQFPPSYSVALP